MTAEQQEQSNDEVKQEGEAAPTTKPATASPPEEPPRDEEGLLLSYDVIICGTGLVQSILASALTRAGKTVLHCDGNDHYGELDTVWTFDYLQELLKKKKHDNATDAQHQQAAPSEEDTGNQILLANDGSYQSLRFHSSGSQTVFPVTEIGTDAQTPYGRGRVAGKVLPTAEKDYGSLAFSLSDWTMADGTSPTVYMGLSKEQLDETTTAEGIATTAPEQAMERHFQSGRSQEVTSMRTTFAQNILEKQSRSLALDATPMLLYASGPAVQGFLTSGVAEHLEFQTMEAVYWLQQHQDDPKSKKKKGGSSLILERVPCSKGDVFQSSLLPPLDKRRFMKFFQLAMDYATERELMRSGEIQAAAAEATNEENTEEGVLSLNERQLNQGRSLARPQNKAVSQKDLQTLYDCMEKNMDFDSYMSNHAKLSAQLRQLVRHSLALEIDGREGDVGSSLTTQEGMGRLCDHLKALGRYGTTAFLAPLYGSGELSQFFCRSAAVYGATYLLRRIPTTVTLTENTNDGTKQVQGVVICTSSDEDPLVGGPPQEIPKEKHIQASHVVFAQEAKLHAPTQRRLLRRISVLRGSIVPSVSRPVIIIPPRGVGDHKYAIHGVVLDEGARVAPHGCSVLHLTTVIDQKDTSTAEGEAAIVDILNKALQVILESAAAMSGDAADEIFHATFSYDLHDDQRGSNSDSVVNGLHVISRPAMPMVADMAFEQAQRIFTKICGPDEEFLAISLVMQEKLKEHLQDAYRGPNQAEDDTEQVVLDSAMEMLS